MAVQKLLANFNWTIAIGEDEVLQNPGEIIWGGNFMAYPAPEVHQWDGRLWDEMITPEIRRGRASQIE